MIKALVTWSKAFVKIFVYGSLLKEFDGEDAVLYGWRKTFGARVGNHSYLNAVPGFGFIEGKVIDKFDINDLLLREKGYSLIPICIDGYSHLYIFSAKESERMSIEQRYVDMLV